MCWLHCTNVTVKDVHLTNPGAWTLNCFQSRDATVERVTIRTRNTGLVNNNGIDLDSCEGVRIRDCDIDSGDDALCLKATSPLPCRSITASGCKLSTKCNAIKLGTESLGDFEKISVTDCQIRDTGMAGIALYSVDGAQMCDVTINGITMDGVTVPICVRLGARQIGLLINGITNHPVENLTLENIQIELAGGGKLADAQIQLPEKEKAYPKYSMFGKVMPAYGLYARHVRGISFKNVQTTVKNLDARPANIFIDIEGVTSAGFASSPANSK
jgi:polygalacturonase